MLRRLNLEDSRVLTADRGMGDAHPSSLIGTVEEARRIA
jgi:hypothetical protein